jgi:hypothetical protein
MTLEKPELKWIKTAIKSEFVHCAVRDDFVFMIFDGLKLVTVRLWENRELIDTWNYHPGKISIEEIKQKIDRLPTFAASKSRLKYVANNETAPMIETWRGFFFSALPRALRTRFERLDVFREDRRSGLCPGRS